MTGRLVTPQEYARLAKGAKGAGGPFEIIDVGAWQGRQPPPRRWLVENIVPEKHVTTLGGHGGIGKSILMMQLCIAAALGRDWLGFSTRPCKTLFISAEDDQDEIQRRAMAILQHNEAEPGDLEGRFMPVDRTQGENVLMTFPSRYEPGEMTALYSQIMNSALDHGAELVALDSRYDFFGGEQIDTGHAHQFITGLRTIAQEINGAVVMLSHPSLSGLSSGDGESGSVAWHNRVRSRLYLRKADPDRDGPVETVLESRKANYAGTFQPIGLTWQDGAFLADRPSSGMVAVIEKGRATTLFLACLDAAIKQGRDVSHSPNASNYAPKVFSRMTEGERLSKRNLETAMQSLLSSNAIRIETFGPPSRGWRRIVRAE